MSHSSSSNYNYASQSSSANSSDGGGGGGGSGSFPNNASTTGRGFVWSAARGRGRPITKQQQQHQDPGSYSEPQGEDAFVSSRPNSRQFNRNHHHHRQQQQQRRCSSELEDPVALREEAKVELSELFQRDRALLSEVYTIAGGAAPQAHEALKQSHPALTDSQLEELAKLVIKATEEGHSHLSLLGQVNASRAAISLLLAYGQAFQHRLDGLLLLRIRATQSRVRRSVERNCVTGYDEEFAEFLGQLATGVDGYRSKAVTYFLTLIDSFLSVSLPSIDRWRRAIMPMHEFKSLLFDAELRAACPSVNAKLSSIGRQLAMAETDRFMAGSGCTFVRPLLSELLEQLRSERLLPVRQ